MPVQGLTISPRGDAYRVGADETTTKFRIANTEDPGRDGCVVIVYL